MTNAVLETLKLIGVDTSHYRNLVQRNLHAAGRHQRRARSTRPGAHPLSAKRTRFQLRRKELHAAKGPSRTLRDLPGFRPGALNGPRPIDSVGKRGREGEEERNQKERRLGTGPKASAAGPGPKTGWGRSSQSGHGNHAWSRHSRSPTRTRGAPATGPPRTGPRATMPGRRAPSRRPARAPKLLFRRPDKVGTEMCLPRFFRAIWFKLL